MSRDSTEVDGSVPCVPGVPDRGPRDAQRWAVPGRCRRPADVPRDRLPAGSRHRPGWV